MPTSGLHSFITTYLQNLNIMFRNCRYHDHMLNTILHTLHALVYKWLTETKHHTGNNRSRSNTVLQLRQKCIAIKTEKWNGERKVIPLKLYKYYNYYWNIYGYINHAVTSDSSLCTTLRALQITLIDWLIYDYRWMKDGIFHFRFHSTHLMTSFPGQPG